MSEELKPCPHCGETKYLKLAPYRADDDGGEPFDWGFNVLCSALGFEHRPRGCGSSGAWGETQEEAVAAWNRRPSPPVVERELGDWVQAHFYKMPGDLLPDDIIEVRLEDGLKVDAPARADRWYWERCDIVAYRKVPPKSPRGDK